MTQPPEMPPPEPAEEPQEEPRSEEERAQARIDYVRDLIMQEESALDLEPLRELHPADQAEVLLGLSKDGQQLLLAALSVEEVARVLEQMEPQEAADALREVTPWVVADILDAAHQDVAADVLKQLPSDQATQTLRAMLGAPQVINLMQYPDETAGGLMTPQYPVARDTMTAAIALDTLRLLGPRAEEFSTLFVVDAESVLVGALSIARLALARPAAPMADIMDREVVSVPAEADQEECARLVERYDLTHLPVVDEDHRLVGVILLEDVVDVLQQEATEDMYRISGIGRERLAEPLRASVRHRMPWLAINLGTTLVAALAIGLFESTIAQVAVLAMFLPVVAGEGGISGTQTLTLMVRSLALGELAGRREVRLLVREVVLGLLHGLLLGALVGLLAYAWKGSPLLGAILAVAMVGNMMVAGLAGAGIPLLLRRLRLDPAVSSAVFVTTFTDVAGFVLFLGLAALFVGSLA